MSTLMKPQISPATRKSLECLQELLVRLYFSNAVQKKVSGCREKALAEFGISSVHFSLIPDPSSANFQAECWGRRIMIARELHNRFPRFSKGQFGVSSSVASWSRADFFLDFLDSDNFFLTKLSLEHPYGIGRGYENVSKFFLWILHRQESQRSLDSDQLNKLFLDFACFIADMAKHSNEPFYLKAKLGVTFFDHNNSDFCFILSKGKTVRAKVPASLDKLFNLRPSALRRQVGYRDHL